jgi:hypothetical protein
MIVLEYLEALNLVFASADGPAVRTRDLLFVDHELLSTPTAPSLAVNHQRFQQIGESAFAQKLTRMTRKCWILVQWTLRFPALGYGILMAGDKRLTCLVKRADAESQPIGRAHRSKQRCAAQGGDRCPKPQSC